MARPHKKTDIPSPEWWKHLRPFNKKRVWKKDRASAKKIIGKICHESLPQK